MHFLSLFLLGSLSSPPSFSLLPFQGLFSSEFFPHFSRSFSFVSIKIIILRKKIALCCFFPLPSLLLLLLFLNSFPITYKRKKKKKKTAALPASQFFCSKDKRSFRIRGEGGKAKKKKKKRIPVKNLHQGQKPDRKALFEGNVKGEGEGIGN